MTRTEHDTVEQVCNRLGCPESKSMKITETLTELIKPNLESGDDALVSGFGTFCIRNKHRHQGRNPATGENLMLKPRQGVTFKRSGKLRNKVNAK